MIKFQAVSKSFNGLQVLNKVSFEVQTNEVVGLLGPSGSGKTTLLRLIAGTLKADSGNIEVGSTRIGYIFQDHRLLPWRTAVDNISLVIEATGLGKKEAREKASAWMDRLGLKGFYHYYPAQLSGGMIQRVSIARAFAVEPQIMLMDEPFSSLDTDLADSLLRELKQVLADYRTTVIYVTHDFIEALSMADKLFRIKAGQIEEISITDRQTMMRNYLASRIKYLKTG